jgi:hypothetical protein
VKRNSRIGATAALLIALMLGAGVGGALSFHGRSTVVAQECIVGGPGGDDPDGGLSSNKCTNCNPPIYVVECQANAQDCSYFAQTTPCPGTGFGDGNDDCDGDIGCLDARKAKEHRIKSTVKSPAHLTTPTPQLTPLSPAPAGGNH